MGAVQLIRFISMTAHRFLYMISCVLLPFFLHGQVISFHDDTLKINKTYIDARISSRQLDRIVGSKHKTVKAQSDFQINTHTGKFIKQVTLYYPALGFYFRTYADDPAKFSMGVKLSTGVDAMDNFDKKLQKPFSGYLFIIGYDFKKIKTIEEIKQNPNLTVSFKEVTIGAVKTLVGAEIIHQKDVIRVNTGKDSKEIASLHLYHNFRH